MRISENAVLLRFVWLRIFLDHCKGLPLHFNISKNNDPLPSLHDKKKPRGTSTSAQTEDVVLKYTKWKDNQVMSVLSTVYGEKEEDSARRWSRDEKKLCLSSDLQLLLL